MNWTLAAGARGCLALIRLGGMATTQQLHGQTGSMAVHTDIAAARELLAHLGVCDQAAAIDCRRVGATVNGHAVMRYSFRPGIMEALRPARMKELLADMVAGRATRKATADAAAPPPRAQTALFDHTVPAHQRHDQLR